VYPRSIEGDNSAKMLYIFFAPAERETI